MADLTRLHELYDDQGQSPWIDNLTRIGLRSGHLQQLVDQGIRGVTSNPTIFQKAIAGSGATTTSSSVASSPAKSVEEAYWELVFARHRRRPRRPAARCTTAAGGVDGFVILEVAPALAHDTDATIQAAPALRTSASPSRTSW